MNKEKSPKPNTGFSVKRSIGDVARGDKLKNFLV
jgi:hypothetical protein